MTARYPAFEALSAMESDVRDAVRWAALLTHLVETPSTINPSILYVISSPIRDLALRLEVNWEAAFRAVAGQP